MNDNSFSVYDFLESLSENDRKEIISILPFLATDDNLKSSINILIKYHTEPHTLSKSERDIVETYLRWCTPSPPTDTQFSDESNDKIQ